MKYEPYSKLVWATNLYTYNCTKFTINGYYFLIHIFKLYYIIRMVQYLLSKFRYLENIVIAKKEKVFIILLTFYLLRGLKIISMKSSNSILYFSQSPTTQGVMEWALSQRRQTPRSPRWWWTQPWWRTLASTPATPAWAVWPMWQCMSSEVSWIEAIVGKSI